MGAGVVGGPGPGAGFGAGGLPTLGRHWWYHSFTATQLLPRGHLLQVAFPFLPPHWSCTLHPLLPLAGGVGGAGLPCTLQAVLPGA